MPSAHVKHISIYFKWPLNSSTKKKMWSESCRSFGMLKRKLGASWRHGTTWYWATSVGWCIMVRRSKLLHDLWMFPHSSPSVTCLPDGRPAQMCCGSGCLTLENLEMGKVCGYPGSSSLTHTRAILFYKTPGRFWGVDKINFEDPHQNKHVQKITACQTTVHVDMI